MLIGMLKVEGEERDCEQGAQMRGPLGVQGWEHQAEDKAMSGETKVKAASRGIYE